VLRATLSISPDSTHIRRMAKSPEKTTRPAQDDRAAKPKRRSPLTDFMDAAEPLHRGGFAEAPQAEFTGAPLTGSISDWAEQISREAEKEGRQVISPLEGEMSAKPTEGATSEGTTRKSSTAAATPPGPTGHPPLKGGGIPVQF
jgi:excinuclease ABC subunit B